MCYVKISNYTYILNFQRNADMNHTQLTAGVNSDSRKFNRINAVEDTDRQYKYVPRTGGIFLSLSNQISIHFLCSPFIIYYTCYNLE